MLLTICMAGAMICLSLDEAKAETLAQPTFHLAESAPEKTLDRIIRRSEEGAFVDDLLKVPGASGGNHQDMFTAPLLKAFADVEARVVQENCRGEYVEGPLCGLDGNPVSCGQDSDVRPYVYRTLKQDGRVALVVSHWQGVSPDILLPSYRLVKMGNEWKVDGVQCGDGLKFNMK